MSEERKVNVKFWDGVTGEYREMEGYLITSPIGLEIVVPEQSPYWLNEGEHDHNCDWIGCGNTHAIFRMKAEYQITDDDLCSTHCGKSLVEEHICPFHEDVNNDKEYMCRCCDDCEDECALSI